jgi:hypothetical protein
VIIRRFHGVAEEICKTHWIVLANRSKLRVRSIKWLGWDLCVKSGIFLRGFLGNSQDTRKHDKDWKKHKGLNRKQPYHLLPLVREGQEPAGAPGHSGRQRWGRPRARTRLWTERGGRLDLGCVLTSGWDGRRWPNLDRRQEDSGGDMRLGLLPRNPLRDLGDRESAWVACGAGMRVCAAKVKRGPHARASRELEKILPWRLTGTETEGKKEKTGIRWEWPPNAHGKGKMERKRRDERDGVLTFGQGWTMATEELAGVAEESPELGKTT